MPELAEVEYFRKKWDRGIGKRVFEVKLHSHARVFRDCDPKLIRQKLPNKAFLASFAFGKQMLFQFGKELWLGIHLGMTGKLRVESGFYDPQKHDHLVLHQKEQSLVFSDPRLFGKILFQESKEKPLWWTQKPPGILTKNFTVERLSAFLKRRSRSPIKTVLLDQEMFPGIGNWMADEILWRSQIFPGKKCGTLTTREIETIWKQTRKVTEDALRVIGKKWGPVPNSWLFNHRWKAGGICPKTKKPLERLSIGGRTSCWSPTWQK